MRFNDVSTTKIDQLMNYKLCVPLYPRDFIQSKTRLHQTESRIKGISLFINNNQFNKFNKGSRGYHYTTLSI